MATRIANTHDPIESLRKYRESLDRGERSLDVFKAAERRNDGHAASDAAMNVAYWLGRAETERSYATSASERAIKPYNKRLATLERQAVTLPTRRARLA